MSECNSQYPYEKDGICSDTCPNYILNSKCVDNCNLGNGTTLLLSGNMCVEKCVDPDKLLEVNGTHCLDKCPDSQYLLEEEKKCATTCPSPWYYLKNEMICVKQCPTKYPYIATIDEKKYCTDDCTYYGQYLNSNNFCEKPCPSGMFVLPPENKCVTQCIGNYPYANTINKFCENKCPDTLFVVEKTKECFGSCPGSFQYVLGDTNECIEDCSRSENKYKFIKTGVKKCVTACDSNTFPFISYDQTTCVQTCDSIFQFQKGDTNECIDECKGEYPFLLEGTSKCISKCADDQKISPGTPNECVSQCPIGKEYILNNICINQCKGTAKPYINSLTNECVLKCDIGYEYLVRENDGTLICYDSCPLSNPIQLGNTKECSTGCNSDYPYFQDCFTTTNDPNVQITCVSNLQKCLKQCEYPRKYLWKEKSTCVENCDSHLLYGDTEICVNDCTDNFPYLLSETNKCVNECASYGKYLYKENRICLRNCPNGFKSVLPGSNQCVAVCPDSLPYKDELTSLCMSKCPDSSPYFDNGQCKLGCDGKLVITAIKQCVSRCPDEYPYSLNLTSCVNKCDIPPFLLADEKNHICLKDCSDSVDAILQFNDKCVVNCPKFTAENGNSECIFDLQFDSVEDDVQTSGYNLTEMETNLDENIVNLLNHGKIIQGEDFILEVYPTSEPFPDKEGISSLNFSKCEKILRKSMNIPASEKIIIAKLDYTKNESLTKTVKYKAYRENGEPLSLSQCENAKTELSSPLNEKFVTVLEQGYNYSLQKIDIYNPNDEIFTDICTLFESNKTDVLLSDRRKMLYKNVTFCGEECDYLGIDYITKKVNCDCSTKGNIEAVVSSVQEVDPNYLNESNTRNLNVLKCSKLLKVENVVSNPSFWAGTAMALSSVSLCVLTFAKEITGLLSSLSSLVLNPPKQIGKDDDYFKETELRETKTVIYHHPIEKKFNFDFEDLESIENSKPKVKYVDNDKSSSRRSFQESFQEEKPKETIIFSKKKQQKFREQDISFPIVNYVKLDYLPFYLALHYDKRKFCSMYVDICKQKILLLRAFCKQSEYELKLLNISIYIIFLLSVCTFNAIFFTNSTIEKTFQTGGQFDFSSCFVRAIYSLIPSIVLYRIIRYFFSFYSIIVTIFKEVTDKEQINILTRRSIAKIKLRVIIFSFFQMGIMLFVWYYLTTFNIVYKYSKITWIFGCLTSLIFLLILNVSFSFLITSFRYFSLQLSNKYAYNVSLFLHKVC